MPGSLVIGTHRPVDLQGLGSSQSSQPSRESGSLLGRSLSFRDSGPALRQEQGGLPREHPPLGQRQVREGGGQYGLQFLGEGARPMTPFGQRYDKGVHGDVVVGPYRVVGDKSRGVEPGFIGRKDWTEGDTAKVKQDGHKFAVKADSFLRMELNPLGGNFHVRKAAEKLLVAKDCGFDPKKEDVYRFLSRNPGIRGEIMSSLKDDPKVFSMVQKHIMETEPKFTKNHYVKLDYRETEGRGQGEERSYTLPKSNAKSFGLGAIGKFFHQMARRQRPDDINRDAMRESLANDLMRSFGIFAQKLKLVQTTYDQGLGEKNPPKLLLDGTHMSGPNGEKFSTFEGAIRGKSPNGQLVRLDPESGKPIKNERGHTEVDTSIDQMGRNKIFMLLLGDRDAIGSSGGNKGRVGNTFAAIDPGHSLELGGQDLMRKRDIHSDMSFDQPSRIGSKCYKNFTMFDQCSFSERMEGVRQLREQARTGEDLRVFDDYARAFGEGAREGLDFSEQIAQMKEAYIARRDYILKEVFAERLGVYDYDMSGVGDAQAQEGAKLQTLDILDTLEKVTSKHTWMSGDTELAQPIVKDRTEWHVSEKGGNVEFSCSDGRSARNRLNAFLEERGLSGTYQVERRDGQLVVTIAKTDLATASRDIGMENLKRHDAPFG